MKYDIKIVSVNAVVRRDEWQSEHCRDFITREQVHAIADELLESGAFEISTAPKFIYDDDGNPTRIDDELINVDIKLRIALPESL